MKWYTINAKAGTDGKKRGEINIYDAIGWYGVSASSFIKDLRDLGDVEEIDLHLSSPGGSVFDGFTIFNRLKDHPAKVTVHIDGMAASIASVIAMAGDEVRIAENGQVMIHNPMTVAVGDKKAMERAIKLLGNIEDAILNAYQERTGIARRELVQMMDAETWLTAQEAKDKGFVDVVTGEVQVDAKFDAKDHPYNAFPDSFFNASARPPAPPPSPSTDPTPKDPPMDLNKLKNEYPDLYKQVQSQTLSEHNARVQEIKNHTIPGHEALAEKAINEGMTPEQFLQAQTVAEKAVREAAKASMDANAPKAANFMPAATVDQQAGEATANAAPKANTEEAFKKEFAASAELQKEFGTEALYLAYKRAEAQ